MTSEQLKDRTRRFALRIIRVAEALPRTRAAMILGSQLIRSGTSVGANYRAACRAKSPADFIAKLGIVEEEADESLYWMELIVDAKLLPKTRLADLMREAGEIVAITVASINTARGKKRQRMNPQSAIRNPK
ncbi:MAG TPA: four helix bundle protein [Phycisphaerales bacterium]|nr:four helix bundle protein [Phycisphaerales bacterium]